MDIVEYCKTLMDYDPFTGRFIWKVNRYRVSAGEQVGSQDTKGYLKTSLRVDGKRYNLLLHRLAYEWVNGACPKFIDHVDGCRSNNRIENLRPACPSKNQMNVKTRRKGLKGATKIKATGKWLAQIKVDGKNRNLGHFDAEIDAHNAYWAAAQKYFGEYARKE